VFRAICRSATPQLALQQLRAPVTRSPRMGAPLPASGLSVVFALPPSAAQSQNTTAMPMCISVEIGKRSDVHIYLPYLPTPASSCILT
jgi:hypothetical protein